MKHDKMTDEILRVSNPSCKDSGTSKLRILIYKYL